MSDTLTDIAEQLENILDILKENFGEEIELKEALSLLETSIDEIYEALYKIATEDDGGIYDE